MRVSEPLAMPQTSAELISMDVEDIAEAILELMEPRTNIQQADNFAAEFTSRLKDTNQVSNSDLLKQAVLEGWHWLDTHGMIAPQQRQEGWYFVTILGHRIKTAAGLKRYLAEQQNKATADYEKNSQEVAKMLEQLRSDMDSARKSATEEANKILASARKTAEGISLRDVQTQFATAARGCLVGSWIWGGLSIVCIATFAIVLIGFVTWWEPTFQTAPGDKGLTSAGAIYHTVIRISILTAIAAVAIMTSRCHRQK